MLIDPAPLPQQGNLPEDALAQIPMKQQMSVHRQKLEEIRKKLYPGTLDGVLDADVNTYKNDISSIFKYMEEIEGTGDVFNYITSTNTLNDILADIMIEFQTALRSWNMSNEVDSIPSQRSEAFQDYMQHLKKCYGLLRDALKNFKPVKEAQQGTN